MTEDLDMDRQRTEPDGEGARREVDGNDKTQPLPSASPVEGDSTSWRLRALTKGWDWLLPTVHHERAFIISTTRKIFVNWLYQVADDARNRAKWGMTFSLTGAGVGVGSFTLYTAGESAHLPEEHRGVTDVIFHGSCLLGPLFIVSEYLEDVHMNTLVQFHVVTLDPSRIEVEAICDHQYAEKFYWNVLTEIDRRWPEAALGLAHPRTVASEEQQGNEAITPGEPMANEYATQREPMAITAAGGRPRSADDEWARQQVQEIGRARNEVYVEWLERIGERGDLLANPKESFAKLIKKKRKK